MAVTRSRTLAQAQPPRVVTDALLIGVDLGPNLSITGSLATILWLTAIRTEIRRRRVLTLRARKALEA